MVYRKKDMVEMSRMRIRMEDSRDMQDKKRVGMSKVPRQESLKVSALKSRSLSRRLIARNFMRNGLSTPRGVHFSLDSGRYNL